MISKVATVAALFAIARAGQYGPPPPKPHAVTIVEAGPYESPPPKAQAYVIARAADHHGPQKAHAYVVAQTGHYAPPPPPKSHAYAYAVPFVAKVAYPAPTITKSVETYSAPSIEKTTYIIRTVTAPINAPPVKVIQYAAPAAPVLKAAPVALAAPVLKVAPAPATAVYAAPPSHQYYSAPATVLTSQPAYEHGHKVLATPTLAIAVPSSGHASYAPHGLGHVTYRSPAHGYKLASSYSPITVIRAAPHHKYSHSHYHH